MFRLFKKVAKTQETGVIGAPVLGKVINIEEVNDEIFSQKMMGEGFAVIPENSSFVSPCDGVLTAVFPTGHAFGVRTPDGLEILVHIGIDTVSEKGKGFKILKKADDIISRGEAVIEVDLNYLKSKGYDLVTPCVVTNHDICSTLEFKVDNDEMSVDSIIGTYTKN
jgi:sugar PTS system EIIA component